MVLVRQFGADGVTYDTKDYPFVLLRDDAVDGRFSTLSKAHQGRLMTALNNPESKIMLYDERTKKFISWRRQDLSLFEKYKEEPHKYFEMLESKKE